MIRIGKIKIFTIEDLAEKYEIHTSTVRKKLRKETSMFDNGAPLEIIKTSGRIVAISGGKGLSVYSASETAKVLGTTTASVNKYIREGHINKYSMGETNIVIPGMNTKDIDSFFSREIVKKNREIICE